MKQLVLLFLTALIVFQSKAQTDSATSNIKILLIPYQGMMHFSDADPDIARFSKRTEQQVRNQLRNSLEKNVYHQLLSAFQVVSIINATTLNAEDDLKKIYAATQYFSSSSIPKDKGNFSSNLFRKTDKKQQIYVNDTAVMVAEIQNPALYNELQKKHQQNFILNITQFEINTSNKNTIEWLKQEYTRTYTIHYNLWSNDGKLILAETITIHADGTNQLTDIESKYLIELATKMRDILKKQLL